MTTSIKTDICVIGAGSGGLSVAAGAAQMGADVVLFERDRMGGDCLNHGCVPSKSLLAAAKHAHGQTDGAEFGVARRIRGRISKVGVGVQNAVPKSGGGDPLVSSRCFKRMCCEKDVSTHARFFC